ncbi:heavy metal-associated isoprenylated plant protein 41-like [Vicia villosa]|uniref:heavy metal-associated isoprenylated plant protein 41-like n=1 Tax=Vicia villosa TaxID=3911 RepID=UPI00273CCD4A|nr:heavy metal-associated isoprenylated plant protein 41-like [Vicia villosa]
MEEKRIMHYRSSHIILLVGEGDFSFSLSLARAFGSASNMVATSLDSRESLVLKYGSASSNLSELEVLGCTVLHNVDVGNMSQHLYLKNKSFDRIIFNFPHAGFVCRESDELQILLHRRLVSGFFKSAKSIVSSSGEIHVSHKTSYPFFKWDIEGLAVIEGLILIEEVDFQQSYYPGYSNKRGSGSQCDHSFPIGMSSTFKFCCLTI